MSKKEKIKSQPSCKLGWNYGVTDTLAEIVFLFNIIEGAGYTVCDVDIERDAVNGSWEYICKVVK